MRRLFTVTAILVLLAPALGCESCLFRGAKAPAYPACPPACEPACAAPCSPGCGAPGGCGAGCAPAVTMPGPAG